MHSFAPALIAAALATLVTPAPIDLDLPSMSPNVDVLAPAARNLHARAAALSVAAIFETVYVEIQAYTEQLTYIAPSNCTIDEITSVVSSIKAPIDSAIPQLQALVGLEASVILAPADIVVGAPELTVSEVADIVGCEVDKVLGAVGHVLDVVDAIGGTIVADVKGVLSELGCAVSDLVCAVDSLVDGLAVSLTPVVQPYASVVYDLDLKLAVLLDLKI